MAVFVLTDVFASFNSRKLVIYIIFCEAFANLIVILYTNWISGMPYPDYFYGAEAYKQVFQPIIILYISNLGGTIISAIIDLFIFYYLYKQKRWSFFISSFASSIITISCYTFVTDYFGFRISYPEHLWVLTNINLITNLITLLFYSIIGQFIVALIQKFLNERPIFKMNFLRN